MHKGTRHTQTDHTLTETCTERGQEYIIKLTAVWYPPSAHLISIAWSEELTGKAPTHEAHNDNYKSAPTLSVNECILIFINSLQTSTSCQWHNAFFHRKKTNKQTTVKTTVISTLALALSVHLNPLKVHASLNLYKEAKCSFGVVENQLSKLEDK